MNKKHIKIFMAIGLSLLITLVINKIFFIANSPRSNPYAVSTLTQLFSRFRPISKNQISPAIPIISPAPIIKQLPIPTANPVNKPLLIQNSPTPVRLLQSTPIPPTIYQIVPTSPQQINKPTSKPPTPIPSSPQIIPTESPMIPAPQSSSHSYGSIEILSAPTDRPAATHPDLNLLVRGYAPTNGTTNLLDIGGDTDLKAPQLTSLLNEQFPPIIKLYKVYEWDWNSNRKGGLISYPDATMFGIQATPGESIHVPISQYDIGGGYQVMVLYATNDSITFKYSREDNVVIGYTIHLQDIWVDPNLVEAYEQANANGRSSLPALAGGEILGIARTNEVKMVMRDSGAFMDVRSRKDWWH